MKLFILPALLVAGQAAAQSAKIMPLGASIVTECWRAKLWKSLTEHGLTNTDFVGSQQGRNCGFPYDPEHEGHGGALAIEYVEKNWLPGYLNTSKPDIILMLLGTNDVIQRKKTDDIIKAYTKIVEQMRASKANMQIIISQLLPIDNDRFPGANEGIIALNKAIEAWAPTVSTQRSPVVIVDNYNGFNTKTDTTDGEHPNDAGNVKIAATFYPATAKAVRSLQSTQYQNEGYETKPSSTTWMTSATSLPAEQPSQYRFWRHGRPPN